MRRAWQPGLISLTQLSLSKLPSPPIHVSLRLRPRLPWRLTTLTTLLTTLLTTFPTCPALRVSALRMVRPAHVPSHRPPYRPPTR